MSKHINASENLDLYWELQKVDYRLIRISDNTLNIIREMIGRTTRKRLINE